MGGTLVQKAKFSAYHFKGAAQVLFNKWKEEMTFDVGPLKWEMFKVSSHNSFIPFR